MNKVFYIIIFITSSLLVSQAGIAINTYDMVNAIANCQVPNSDVDIGLTEDITAQTLLNIKQEVLNGKLQEAGVLYSYLNKDYPDMAICWLTLAAEKGISYDQEVLAENYEKGRYVKRNINKAIYWYTQAAQNERSSISAQLSLGNIYAQGELIPKNNVKAFYWYQQAAQDENVDSPLYGEATFKVGYAYHYGIGVAKDEKKALLAYNRAIDSASRMDSSQAYANMYETGLGVKKDLEKAADYYFYAAIAGDKSAQFKMNELYREGKGVPQDNDMADGWLEISQLTPEQLSVNIYE